MAGEFQVTGKNNLSPFTLKLHRGDGMVLLAMNWKTGVPPSDFVGFSIEYKEPGGDRFLSVTNRISFPGVDLTTDKASASSLRSPIQKFRWIHFPFKPELPGEFLYKVKPVFMDSADMLSYGEPQEAAIELRRETYPDVLNVTFTRGFVSSQAFVRKYEPDGGIDTLIPTSAKDGLVFLPTHPKSVEALAWMGFEARSAILEVLDQAIKDKAKVRFIAYDLNDPEILSRLEKCGKKVKAIIDSSPEHFENGAAENEAASRLEISAGTANVRRQKMRNLQHNKMIVVDGPTIKKVVCGSTNFSWRGMYVQNNNAVILSGAEPVRLFTEAFEEYWPNDPAAFDNSTSASTWQDLGLANINAKVTFSPHGAGNAVLKTIADDVAQNTTSSLFYSLAFLAQTGGSIRDEITKLTGDNSIFVYGMADKRIGGFELLKPDGNAAPVFPSFLAKNLPEPFKSEPSGLSGNVGTRMHHKFIVIDFDKPTARVYLGSYNFSNPADRKNGENLLLIRDRRIAVSYTVEALRIFDHYHFRIVQAEAKKAKTKLELSRPPRNPGDVTWWEKDYSNPRRIRDRELFA